MRASIRFLPTVLLLAAVAGCAERSASNGGERHALVGHKAPLFTGVLVDETPFDLGEHLGQGVIVLDFWATWCGPCVGALPVLAKVAEEYKDRGVQFFAIDLAEDPDTVRAFLTQNQLDIRVVLDRDSKIGDDYKVEVIPQTVIIDKEGTIQVVHQGVPPNLKNEISRQLDDVLAGKKLAGINSRNTLLEHDGAARQVEVREIVLK